MGIVIWTSDEDARLKAMILDGKTAGEIADAVKRSRNGVIGRAHRLGLYWERTRAKKKADGRKGLKASPFNKSPKERKKPRSTGESVARIKGDALTALDKRITAALCERDAGRAGVALIALGPRECTWPIREDRGSHLFCGEPAAGRYCEFHAAMSMRETARRYLADA